MDLFDDAGPAEDNTPEFSVSEISGAVKKAIEGGFGFVRRSLWRSSPRKGWR